MFRGSVCPESDTTNPESYVSRIPVSGDLAINPFWQPMCDVIAIVDLGYKSATYEELWGPILQAQKQDINSRLAELKKTWEVTGCTVMSDG